MALEGISTSEFLKTMRKTPIGTKTSLTLGEASLLSNVGIDFIDEAPTGEAEQIVKEEKESKSFWDNVFGTIDNIANSFGRGFVSMFEGIVDFGASIVGNVIDWAGGDSSGVEKFIEVDMAANLANFTETFANFTPWGIVKSNINFWSTGGFGGDYWNDAMKAWSTLGLGQWNGVSDKEYEEWREKYAFSHELLEEDAGWFGDAVLGISEGAGQLVAMWLTAGIGGAAGLSTKGAQALSLASMSIGAAGKGTEEALNEGGDIHQATLYGLLSGATEAATEMIGGIGGDFASGLMGKAALKNTAIKKFTSSLAGKMVAGFLSEGFEEVLSDAVNPLWKKISFQPDLDLGEEYSSAEFWGGMVQSFVVGGILGSMATGVQYYKVGKSTINGKKIGQQAAIQYQEFADVKSDFDLAVKDAFKSFSDIVDMNDIDIADGTSLDKAFSDVQANEEVSEKQKNKLKKQLDKARALSDKYINAQNDLIKEFESRGITADDMVEEYNAQKAKAIEKATKKSKIKASTQTMTETVKGVGVESVIQDGELKIDTESTDPELEIHSSEMAIESEELVEKASEISTEDQTAKIQAVADEMAVPEEQKEKFVQENVAKEVVKQVAKESGADLSNDTHKDIVEQAITESNSIEEAELLAKNYIFVQAPDTSNRHNVGGKEIATIEKQHYSAGFDSICNKFLDDASAVKHFLKRAGFTEAEVNDYIRKVRSSSGVSKNIVESGFFEVTKGEDGKYKIERQTKGLYNGKDGIIDMMQQYATANQIDFDELNGLVQEGLSLLDEIDRQKEGKSVFGVFYNKETLSDSEKVWLTKNFPEMAQRIEAGENISEAEFETEVHDGNHYTGAYLTEEQINNRLEEIRGKVKNFDEIAQELYKINDKILDVRVQGQMLTQAQADEWRKTKPHYVPEFRVLVGRDSMSVNAVRIQGTGMHAAKGSNLAIQDIFLSVEKQIKKVNKFKAMNDLILKLANAQNVEGVSIVKSTPLVTDVNEDIVVDRVQIEGETVYAYQNGEQIEIRVSSEIAESLHSMDGTLQHIGENSKILTAIRKASATVRKLMTTYNPFFSWFRNPIKDIQSAIIFSKNGAATLMKNWGRALGHVVGNSELFQIYETLSGQAITIEDSYSKTGDKSFYKDANRSQSSKNIRKFMKSVANANEIMEHTTRFAEFLSSFDRLTKREGLSYNKAIDVALVDAQEVTLNFSRQGTVTKVLNQYVPFLTANIEAAARNIRAFISPKSAREWAFLILKLLILGIAPQIIQELIYADDEDYQSLSDSFKSNYYLIKVGDQFIRVPKGYIQQAFGSDVVLATKGINGEEVEWDDVKQMLESNWNSIGVDVSGVFFQPIIDAKNNQTWYGGQIVGQEWQNTRPSEQYTDETSEISKFIGKVFGVSPLKIQYALDQMTGIVGDIVLPLTSRKSQNPLKGIVQMCKDQFVTDPVYKNKYSSEFYDYKEELNFDKTDGDVRASVVLSYMNKCSNEISDLKDAQQALLEDKSLSDNDRESQDRAYQVLKNIAYKECVANCKALYKELDNYELSEESLEEDKREAIRNVFGAEEALKLCCSKRVYQKAQCYYKAGISYDDFYVYYFNMKALPDREAVENYIIKLRVSPQIKNLLYALMGYNIGKEKRAVLEQWLKRHGLTIEEIEMIL